MTVLYLILGIVGLWLASEVTISGALDIAERFQLSRGFIGLTVLAVGTDVPELFVNISAAIERLGGRETSDLIIGQTVGTSFGQSGLMLGIAGLFAMFTLSKKMLLRDGLTLVASAVLLFLLSLDGALSRTDGLLLIAVYLLYFASLWREEKIRERIRLPSRKNMLKATLSVIGGLILLGYSSEMTVHQALELSELWGVGQSVIGALIIGLGTSLPELATSAMAIRKGEGNMALGNLIGSTVFDLLLALGAAVTVSGLLVSRELLFMDMVMLILLTGLIFAVLWSRLRLGRREAAVLIIAYLIYAGAKLGGTIDASALQL